DYEYDMFVHSCFASDGQGSTKIDLIDRNGCVNRPQFVSQLSRTKDPSGIMYYFFRITAFKFPGPADVYFSCSVELTPFRNASSAQMGEQWFKSCLPDEYYEKFIAEGIYPDGRSISAFRPLFFKLGAWGGVGSALVKLGGASVSCTVEASLALIHDSPFVFCEIDACASVTQAQVNDVTDLLNKVFTNESLSCRSALLVKGIDKEAVMTWELTLRVQILNSDGSILDAVFCAVSAALFDVRLPSVTLKHAKDDESPLRQEEISILEETTSLALESFPIAFTFHVFKSNNKDY
ncbi:3' exoribonuclease family, domain 1, partial [Teladorsagia circumcincta]